MAASATATEQAPSGDIAKAGGDHEPLSIDAIFNPPDPDAAKTGKDGSPSSSRPAKSVEADLLHGAQAQVDDPNADADKNKKPDPAPDDLVEVKNSRGKTLKVSKDVAEFFKPNEEDYRSLESEFTRRNQLGWTPDKKAKEGEDGEAKPDPAELQAIKSEYNAKLIEAFDHPERNGGPVEALMDVIDDYALPSTQRMIDKAIAKLLSDEIQPWREAIGQSVDLLEGQVKRTLPDYLNDMGYAADAVSAADVTKEYRELRSKAPKDQSDREVYQRSITRVANRNKETLGTPPAKKNGAGDRPAAPHASALRGGGSSSDNRSISAGTPIHNKPLSAADF